MPLKKKFKDARKKIAVVKEEPFKAGHQPVAGLKIQPGRMEKATTFSQIRQEAEPKHRDVIKKIEASRSYRRNPVRLLFCYSSCV